MSFGLYEERFLNRHFGNIASALEKLDKRLDTIEQAIADPHSDAAEELRKKHGLAKQQPARSLSKVSKQKTL